MYRGWHGGCLDLDSVLNLFDRPFHFITLEAFFGADSGGLMIKKSSIYLFVVRKIPPPLLFTRLAVLGTGAWFQLLLGMTFIILLNYTTHNRMGVPRCLNRDD